MKKNISINLQGIIFHIEEDGYEILSRYLAEVKAHFSGYRGHEEIVADIESRIAELFSMRLSSTKQVITLEDVEEMVAKMGRVSDFQSADDAEDDEETLASAVAAGTAAGSYTYSSGTGSGPSATGAASATAATDEPRRLYRDMANRKIAGVAAGIARYFSINPLWIRLGFLVLFFINPVFRHMTPFDNTHFDLAGLVLLAYVILWIALPKRYDTPPTDEDPTFKKLYRDTDNGKVGGVSAGLAAYFKVDVVLVRILFIVFIFAGGFSIPVYIILWILLPEAKTVSDKMRMRGDAVTLSGIDNSLRNNAFEAGAVPSSNRPVGTFLEELFRNVRPLINFLGNLIRWAAGALLVVIGFSMLLGFTIALGVALGWIPESQGFVHTGPFPPYLFMNSVPTWALFAFYATAAIPALAMLLLGIGLLLRRSVLSRTAGLSLLGLWLLSVVGSSIAAARISRDFQDRGTYSTTRSFAPVPYPTVMLAMRDFENSMSRPNITLVSADSGQVIRMEQEVSANGATEEAAIQSAANSITYGVQQRDSVLTFDESYRFRPNATFRDQRVSLVLHLPKDKTYRLSENFSYLLNSESFVNDHRPEDIASRRFRLRGNQLECINCTAEEMRDKNDKDGDDVNVDMNDNDGINVHVNTDDDENGDVSVKIDLGKTSFPTDLGAYGSGRRSFNLNGFERIEANGAYRVYVRQGSEFKIEAAGDERDLGNLRVDTNGEELVIRPRNTGSWFNFSSHNNKPVLVRVTLPTLRGLDLSGACRADVAGFSGESLSVEQSGACSATLNVDVPRLDLDLSGACHTDVRGSATELHAEGSGACQIQALGLQTQRTTLELTGMSQAQVRVSDELRTDLSGASHVEYAGNPSTIKNDVSGSSRVKRIEPNN
ncbi:PspC domain-containing protein [Hymenobacter jejuensis]|uniref:PspC domain-containing protein n=1 Tax=Hymenobacter jejuensis TaxID=2502781 RepID=A0A5B8A460_9BACT|nr:PspC domain-containing protein [Hymenobacter jejuensis]QDA61395.1 PspC domain-containing protein [Hymenobacter jejuensis]